MGRQKLRQQKVLNSSPLEMQFSGGGTVPSRAAAAAGQSGLMALYDSLFGMMDLQAAQVLVTRNDFTGVCITLYSMHCALDHFAGRNTHTQSMPQASHPAPHTPYPVTP